MVRELYSVIQGSLNNHCSVNTLDTLGVKLNIKKFFVLSLVENLQKVKLKECC